MVPTTRWTLDDGVWTRFGLDGRRAIDPAAPVTHVSFFEADAYASWAGARSRCSGAPHASAESRARAAIAMGAGEVFVCAGVESMSRVPMGASGGAWASDPQVAARGMVRSIARSDGSAVRFVGFPAQLSATPASYRRAPPRAGEATRAVLCACVHPSGDGIVTGGDDGKVVWTRRDEEAVVLATAKNQWIDAIDASAASGLIAFSFGRTLSVIDPKEVGFRRDFQHERTVSGYSGLHGWRRSSSRPASSTDARNSRTWARRSDRTAGTSS